MDNPDPFVDAMEDIHIADPPVAVMIPFDEDEEDDDVAMLLDPPGRAAAHRARLHGRAIDSISPLLNDMVKMDYTCTSLLSGWSRPDDQCTRRVEHCREHPDQAFYTSPQTGRTPLHEACLRNACIHVVRALLQANRVSALERDNQGNTPLHLLFIAHSPMSLSAHDVAGIVDALLEVNPSQLANASNAEGCTPLHVACSSPEPVMSCEVFTRLLAANQACSTHMNVLSQTPLGVYCKQPPARTSLDMAQILFDANPAAADVVDVGGRTPLHHAAGRLNTDLVCFLVELAPNAAAVRSGPHSETALHVLCQQNPREEHLSAVRGLLKASPESVTMADRHLSSPLHVLCKNKRPTLDVIRFILETDPGVASMTDSEGYTALHYACENQAEPAVVECLLSAHEKAASVVSRKQDTALHIACSANSSSDTVRLLIKANPAALTMTNDYGFTPLHCVCRAYLPLAGIVEALIEACPNSVTMKTHGGETPMHLACSSGAYVGVLRLLTCEQLDSSLLTKSAAKSMTNKIGNTPLHEACFRGAGFERIETLAKSNPGWITVRNNAGHTPLQILCKGGRLDERIVTAFSRIRGPEVFTVVDQTGHTPLHSASRDGTDVAAIQSLIRAYPDALSCKTMYGDTPLHLACLRGANVDVVRLIAESGSNGRNYSPLLEQNVAGQSPMSIAMESFQSSCRGKSRCCVRADPPRAGQVHFEVLAMLVKLLFYGVSQDGAEQNLVRASVSLHRRDVRLDPAFIRRAIQLYPEDVRTLDGDGNYPLHIEASIPIEKMSLLDSPIKERGCCNGTCHTRVGILEILLEAFPEALSARNTADEFPLSLMIQNGRPWSHAFALALRNFPAALHWYHRGIGDAIVPNILSKVSQDCGSDTLFQLLIARPSLVVRRQTE